MKNVHTVEYCNLKIAFDRDRLDALLQYLTYQTFSVKETDKFLTLTIHDTNEDLEIKFKQRQHQIKLVGSYVVSDAFYVGIMEYLIYFSKGHAVIKRFNGDKLIIENINSGELTRITEIHGLQKNILFERNESAVLLNLEDTWNQASNAPLQIKQQKQLMDYWLSTLSEALRDANDSLEEECKNNLKRIRNQLIEYEYFAVHRAEKVTC
jgi:hypothetical protein